VARRPSFYIEVMFSGAELMLDAAKRSAINMGCSRRSEVSQSVDVLDTAGVAYVVAVRALR
jgi:hypothetical protein